MKKLAIALSVLLVLPVASYAQQWGKKPTKDGFYIGAAYEVRNQYYDEPLETEPGSTSSYTSYSDVGLFAGYRKNDWGIEVAKASGKYNNAVGIPTKNTTTDVGLIKYFPMTRELDFFAKAGVRNITYSFEGYSRTIERSSAMFGAGVDYALTRNFHLRFSGDYQAKVSEDKGGSVYRFGGYYKF